MKVRNATFAVALVTALLTGSVFVSAGDGKEAPAVSPQAKELAAADNQFGLDVLKQLHKDGENRFISPASIAVAVQMAAQAAKGATRDEMVTAMHTGKLDLNESNRALLDALGGRDGVKLNIANALWADPERVSLNKEYVAEMAKYFDAEVRASSFSDPKTLDEINNWIAVKTEQMITKMLEQIPGDAISYVINAIYFKGDWSSKFDKSKTKETDFFLAGGATKRVQMMEQQREFEYGLDNTTQVVKLPYGEDKTTAMWVALPAKGQSLDDLVKGLDASTMQRWRDSVEEGKGTIKLPRFKLRYRETLNDSLQALGIKTAFDDNAADFTRLGKASAPIYIGAVLHEAVIIVNEEGTEAAAATVVQWEAKSKPAPPWSMTCDRPFLIVITDELTGAILFIGTIYNPESE